MNRLQTVPCIRKRPVHDRAQRIGQIPVADGTAQRLGHCFGADIGVIQRFTHRCCDTQGRFARKAGSGKVFRFSHDQNRGIGYDTDVVTLVW